MNIQTYIEEKREEFENKFPSVETELGVDHPPLILKEIKDYHRQTIKDTVLKLLDDIEEHGVVDKHWSPNGWVNNARQRTLDHIQTLREQVSEK